MMGAAGRVRLLHESVDRLTMEVRAAREAWAKNPTELPKEIGPAMNRLAEAMDAGTAQLVRVERRLAQLSRTPILGALGGGAQQEIDSLVGSSEQLIAAIQEIRALFR